MPAPLARYFTSIAGTLTCCIHIYRSKFQVSNQDVTTELLPSVLAQDRRRSLYLGGVLSSHTTARLKISRAWQTLLCYNLVSPHAHNFVTTDLIRCQFLSRPQKAEAHAVLASRMYVLKSTRGNVENLAMPP